LGNSLLAAGFPVCQIDLIHPRTQAVSFRRFLIPVLCVLLSGLAEAAPEGRPNFLIIIADDLCWRDLGYEGNEDVKTPNLDKLRGESMQLKGMFNPATTCSPTRHALLTGPIPCAAGLIRITRRCMMGPRACSHT
jgi:hypothetical protein